MSTNIKGYAKTRRVEVDGKELTPKESQKIWNHNSDPGGFDWGYCGSGPAQLALAIMLYALPGEEGRFKAKQYHQRFKERFIAPLPVNEDFEIDINVKEWVKNVSKRR